jgi:hypothetical protein
LLDLRHVCLPRSIQREYTSLSVTHSQDRGEQ